MEISNRSLTLVGAVLVGLGILFLVFNFIPGWSIGMAWPFVFFFLAAFFYIPPFLFPSERRWIGSLFIPGSILLVLGLIFLYNTITRDWASWAYAWLLLVSGVGLGLILAGWYGQWGRPVILTGTWLIIVDVALFALFGTLFGGPALKVISPALLVLCGVLLLLRAIRR